MRRKWTDKEINQLKELYATGLSSTGIATVLGRKEGSVKSKAFSIGLKKAGYHWTKEEEMKLKNQYNFTSNKELAGLLNKSPGAVKLKLKRLGLSRENRVVDNRWSPAEDDIILEKYANTDIETLSEMLPKRTSGAIHNRASKLDIKKDKYFLLNGRVVQSSHIGKARKYHFRQDYFECINNQNKAYLLGLLWADGNVSKDLRKCTISFKKEDEEMINFFRLELGDVSSTRLIYYNNNRHSDAVALDICSKQLCFDLENQGVKPAKSYKNVTPNLPGSLISHFVRGLFDGDGNINISSKSRYGVKIVNNRSTCSWLLTTTQGILKVGGGVYNTPSVAFRWELGGRLQVSKFANWIYKDANFFLARKYNKFVSSGLLERSL